MNQKSVKLVLSGACGKMGKRIIALGSKDKQFNLVGLIEEKTNAEVNSDPEVIKKGDALIEFSTPLATVAHLSIAEKYKKAMVIGTTGLDAQQMEKIRMASKTIPIIFSPNMSLGVNLVFRLVKEAAARLGKDYKIDIAEAHHRHKKDAPSGTAKRLAELIKQNPNHKSEDIKIDSIRKGEIVGDHQIRFDGPKDTIIIKHSAKTRDIFAQGALAAAKFAVRQRPGLYDMQDVIA